MLWSFKNLATFSHERPSSSALQAEHLIPTTYPTIPAYPQIVEESLPTTSATLTRTCQCGFQQTDYCPYCEFNEIQPQESIETHETSDVLHDAPSFSTPVPVANTITTATSSKPRTKLRKSRPDYFQLQHGSMLQHPQIHSPKPESIASTHSRTPLLNAAVSVNTNYIPLPPQRRTTKKLEKRDKRSRSGSLPNIGMLAFNNLPEPQSDHESVTVLPSLQKKAIKSKSFLRTKTAPTELPPPLPSSIHTDALVSLAWTGEVSPPTRHTLYCLNERQEFPQSLDGELISHMSESSDSHNAVSSARLLRRKESSPTKPALAQPRPWTLALAITNDEITDEKLVRDLEELRIKTKSATEIPDLFPLGLGPPPQFASQLYDSFKEYPLEAGEQEEFQDQSWSVARHALLLCREFVRTERRYLHSLRKLITGGTLTPPPSLMLSYLPALITASETFLERMEKNPSVQGVSDAFLSSQTSLEEAFVQWCSVVGQFFVSDDSAETGLTSRTKSRSTTSLYVQTAGDGVPSIVIPEPNKIRRNAKSRPSVRELAIQPTQRIIRYVLLFKELFSFTPSTVPSYTIVDKALKAAQRIAEKADQVQIHSNFALPH
ncbi:hypothetical protein CVT24_005324 [Panaeolus cyanescens]|uniref:DH domain-containing protein n=1 Tax=Panaeolus cyanescens TaxID=181874 RepID=A0A409Y9D0_9AGAR|nr:hypothetical protein CVT24_005324 [Panaeolus cyanescens]